MRNKLIAVLLVLSFFVGFFTASEIIPRPKIGPRIMEEEEKTNFTGFDYVDYNRTAPMDGVEIPLIAVTEEGEGVVTPVWVKSEPGSGKILVDIETIFFWVDTQHSMRLAAEAARDYLGTNLTNRNLVYSIDTNASIVGGPSAGGPLTVATIAALQNRTLKQDIAMTGTIEPDGTIGQVGGVLEKARAAKEHGFETFLLPEGQKARTRYVRKEECRDLRAFQLCRTEYVPEKVNIEKEAGINVLEVKNIDQAVKYLIS